MNTNDITQTQGRLKQSIDNAITKKAMPQITQQIDTAVAEERIRTGTIVKFYHYLDKALVALDNSNEKVLCKILHRFGGELIDLYTPTADRLEYCNDLHEPCYRPRGKIHCLIINIHDSDSDEHLLLGFYNNEELVGLNPAKPGNFKIATRGGTNQFWIKFGYDGLDLRLPKNMTTNVGDMNKDMSNVDYAESDTVYTKLEVYNKTEVYTKEEVDELIAQKIAEALGEDTDDTTS